MNNIKNQYDGATYFFYAAALFHLLAILMSGGALLGTLAFGVLLWPLIGYLLSRFGWRWLAYLGFILALIGSIISFAYALQAFGILRLCLFGIVFTTLGSAVLLFGALWRTPIQSR